MNPLVLQSGAAHDVLVAVLGVWIGLEVLLRLGSTGRRLAWDWTFPVVVAAITAGVSLGFRSAHFRTGTISGGWWPVAVGLVIAVLGIALRIWAITTLGPLFKFVVVIQDGHTVVDRGPYRVIRHPSYTGGLSALLGLGIALDNWISVAEIFLIPLAAVLVRIWVEESKLIGALGRDYDDYAARTRRLIPGLW